MQILIHLVPEPVTTRSLSDPRSGHQGLESFVSNVYDRILQPVERAVPRRLFAHGAHTRAYFYAPAFSLARCPSSSARGQTPRVSFVLETHPSSLDVVDRYTLLHVGYQLSTCGNWLNAVCVDARGEAQELGAWLVPGDSLDTFVVTQVWSFVHGFATRADVEWRIVIAKLGAMGVCELDSECFPPARTYMY